MKTPSNVTIFLALVCGIFKISAIAQRPRSIATDQDVKKTEIPPRKAAPNQVKVGTSTRTKQVGPSYLTGPLSPSATNLGPHFRGHDIKAVVEKLEKTAESLRKSEFETTEEFQRRISNFNNQSHPYEYVFVLHNDPGAYGGVNFTYDADKSVLNAVIQTEISLGAKFLDEPQKVDGFSIEFKSQGTRTSYVGMNSFGAKTVVTSRSYDAFGLILAEDSPMFGISSRTFRGQREAILSLDMPVQRAKLLKSSLQVALICTVVQPRVYIGYHGHEATISEPTESFTTLKALLVHPESLWIFDDRTGEVLGKFVEKQ